MSSKKKIGLHSQDLGTTSGPSIYLLFDFTRVPGWLRVVRWSPCQLYTECGVGPVLSLFRILSSLYPPFAPPSPSTSASSHPSQTLSLSKNK